MARLTEEDKKKIIELYDEGYGYTLIAKALKISRTRITEIVKQYASHGIEALKITHRNRTYSNGFKIGLIKRVYNGESLVSVAVENKISSGQLSNWMKKYEEFGYNELERPKGRPKRMKPEEKTKEPIPATGDEKDQKIRELEEKNKELKMEVDLLKKLRALVQERQKRPKKKR